jgi:DNA (cytosine-5)-methyltransferase 1
MHCAQKKVFAEFFAGIGLMRMGLEQAGWRVAFANDIDQDKLQMYRGHFGAEDNFLLGDVHAIEPAQVPTVALATASFPCNDLSLAGAREGLAGEHSSAFWGFINVLIRMDDRRPPLVMLENVPGFLTSHGGADFRDALKALNRLGYAVDALLINASHFVPQSRLRLFVIGSRISQSVQDKKAQEMTQIEESEVRPAALTAFIRSHSDIRWNIRPLPPLPVRQSQLADMIESVPPNSKMWWSRERCDYLLNQMSPKHLEQARSMIAGDATQCGTVFRRVRRGVSMAELRTDGVAGCLRTPRGGSGRQILFAAGKGKFSVRLLSPTECARLMGADGFNIKVSLNRALFGFGDAVSVPVVQWVAENYVNRVWEERAIAQEKYA